MSYLVSIKDHWKKKAHIWNGDDTLCRMHSTGGIKPEKYKLCNDSNGKEICHMCSIALRERGFALLKHSPKATIQGFLLIANQENIGKIPA